MPTAYKLCSRALRLCCVHAAGEPLPPDEAQDALDALNTMLNTWRLSSLLVYALDRQLFSAVASQGTYTLGPGGNWDTTPLYGASTPRPARVDRWSFVDNSATPVLEIPRKVLREDEWQQVRLKGITSTWSTELYYTSDVPLGHATLWPVPTLGRQVALYLWHPLPGFGDLTTDVLLADGYEEAITYNLARRIAPEYGKQLLPDTIQTAVEAKAAIMVQNAEPPVLQLDPLVQPTGMRGLNWLTGDIDH